MTTLFFSSVFISFAEILAVFIYITKIIIYIRSSTLK